jgi:hypothetical protein
MTAWMIGETKMFVSKRQILGRILWCNQYGRISPAKPVWPSGTEIRRACPGAIAATASPTCVGSPRANDDEREPNLPSNPSPRPESRDSVQVAWPIGRILSSGSIRFNFSMNLVRFLEVFDSLRK